MLELNQTLQKGRVATVDVGIHHYPVHFQCFMFGPELFLKKEEKVEEEDEENWRKHSYHLSLPQAQVERGTPFHSVTGAKDVSHCH